MDTKQQLAHLAEMRALMERSTRFLSLSGLSGVWAGLCALAGAVVIYSYFEMGPFSEASNYDLVEKTTRTMKWGMDYKSVFVLVALLVLVAALAGGVFFTTRKARQRGEKIWDASSRRLLIAMAIPLIAGGFFCIALLERGFVSLLAPSTLIFYGLALVMGGKYTLRDVEYLGICELALGLTGVYYPGFGLELWAFGFGFLHIGYGLYMYFKYDSSSDQNKA
jgi:hypothetical protein